MTLTTTEELKHLASSDNANELTRRLARECLANREAQPVGYIDPDSLKEYRGQRAGGTWSAVQRTTSGLNMTTPIYTAPPVPANARAVAWEMRYWSDGYNIWGDWERISEELYTRLSAEHAADNDYEFRVLYDAPPAPAVPAVPAVPDGFKLVPVESTDAWAERYCELTNKHPDGGLTTYIGDGAVTITFREKSKREIDAMLAAAPEGGNG